jgi:Glycosyltransferase family 87
MERRFGFAPSLPWLCLLLWLVAQIPIFVGLAERGQSPIDFLTYRVAADAISRGESPYPTPEQSWYVYRYFHHLDAELLAASARGEGAERLREISARPQQPSPYPYPPTLALLIAQLHISALGFAGLTLFAVLGFTWLWLRSAGASSWWLLLVLFSWDVLASLYGGNVELILLFATLLAARLLWAERPVWAAPLIALVVLIKPFYVMFFLVFGLLRWSGYPMAARGTLRSLATAAAGSFSIVAVEVSRWGADLRAAAFDPLVHVLDYQWFVLPVAEQTPLSAWNRTPLQALVSAGLPPATATWAALALWLVCVAVTGWCAYGARLGFPLAFALSFVLLDWGRPILWTLIYWELVVVVVLWPLLLRWQRMVLLSAVVTVMASHWGALALTLGGHGLPLFTLQSAGFPWETWLVLPVSWLVLLRAIALTARRHGESVRPELAVGRWAGHLRSPT